MPGKPDISAEKFVVVVGYLASVTNNV